MKMKMSLLSASILSVLVVPLAANTAPLFLDEPSVSFQEVQQANAWLEVNLLQFESNIRQFKQGVGKASKVCAVMKADAYGNGIAGLMSVVMAEGIPCVAIASNAEARLVRDSGFNGQLIRVRSASAQEIKQSVNLDIEELVGSLAQVKHITDIASDAGRKIKVHLALNDGGMGRNGIDMSTGKGRVEAVAIAEARGIEVVGIMTHFPNYNADEIRAKLVSFNDNSAWLIDNTKLERDKLLLHVANSYTALNVPEAQLDMVRPGGVLYGDLPTNPEYPSIVSFKTRVASLHYLPKGATVGYDSTFTTTRDSILANLPVGYSDGYPRKVGNRSEVIINGQRAKVVGVASMNTCMVDVTEVKGVLPGQEVVLFGAQNKQRISVAELEESAELIFPELYTVWGVANPRIYIE